MEAQVKGVLTKVERLRTVNDERVKVRSFFYFTMRYILYEVFTGEAGCHQVTKYQLNMTGSTLGLYERTSERNRSLL